MRQLLYILLLLPFLCTAQNKTTQKTLLYVEGWLNEKKTDSLNGKPIAYYLNHPKIDKLSKAFYLGKFRVFDNEKTSGLLDSIFTKNEDTKPFFYYNFNRIVDVSDASLAEMVSASCFEYFKQYPCAFLISFRDKHYKVNKATWALFVGYELAMENRKFDPFIKKTEVTINANCGTYSNQDWIKFKKILLDAYVKNLN